MDNFNLRNMQLAYGAIYDQNLCESMEELGLIGEGSSGQDQFELWVNELLDEGYDLSDYTWDELYENYQQLDEISIALKRRAAAASADKAAAADKARRDSYADMSPALPYFERMSGLATAQHNRLVRAAYPSKRNRVAKQLKSQKNSLEKTFQKESYDAFDVVLAYLLDEGFAETVEGAEAIMVNMSEGWIETILEESDDEERIGYGKKSKFNKPDDKIEKPGTTVPAPKKGGYGRIYRNIPYGIGANATRTQSRVTAITGDDPGESRSRKMPTDGKKPVDKSIKRLPR